jgi:DNA-binding NarL/FixJ family response regulator
LWLSSTKLQLGPLSHSDCDLIQRLADDQTVTEIAQDLHTLPNTISGRLQRLRERFGVKTNTGLVAECIKLGLA